jgi:hypothetical protein
MKNLKSQLEKLELLAGKGSEETKLTFYLFPANFPQDMKIEDCLSYQRQLHAMAEDRNSTTIIMVSCSNCKEACRYAGRKL